MATKTIDLDPRFSFIARAVGGLCALEANEVAGLANVEEVRSFLDDASCRVLRIATDASSRLTASNSLEDQNSGRAVSFVKVGMSPLEPTNMSSEVMVTSHGENQTPLRNLYSAVHNLYAPTLLDNDRWSAQLGDKLQELLAKLDTTLGAVVNNENEDQQNNRSSGNDSELYGSPTSILSVAEECDFWSDQTSTGSGRIRSAATRFRDALEPISTRWSSMEDKSTKMKLSQLIDLLEDTQNCFDDVWKVDGLSSDQKYPQARMEHMFGVVASKIGKHVQRALSKIDLFHGPFTTVRHHARGSFVCSEVCCSILCAFTDTYLFVYIFLSNTFKHFQTPHKKTIKTRSVCFSYVAHPIIMN